MGQKHQKFISDLCNLAASNKGIALVEVWTCTKCYAECFCIHRMQEVVKCPHCGHRHASALPRYQSVCELAAGGGLG